MTRVLFAACVIALSSLPLHAADAKPIWEMPVTPSPEPPAAPAWFSYSPDGQAIVAVTVRATAADSPEYTFHLRVWDASTRKERFNAALGTSRSFHWGDDLASFPSDDTVMTGGQAITVRNLQNGGQTLSQATGGLADHAVWAVPDLKESFFVRRDPQRYNMPIEVFHRGQNFNQFDEWGGGRFGGRGRADNMGILQTTLDPPREGMRAEVLAFNAGRTRIAVAFRDDASISRPRHVLTMYRIKTVDNFDLEPVSQVTNPHAGPITSLAFARNGRILATGAEDGSICFWDVTDETLTKPRATISGVAGHRVYSMSFSNDWRYLAAVTWDKAKPNLLLIDVDSGRPMGSLKLERQMTGVAWHPDGHTLLSAGASGTIQAWNVAELAKGN